MLKQLLEKVRNPGCGFRGAPFWAWNGKLEPEELREQIRFFKKMGLGGFFMHSRVGLDTPYLSERWFECVRACVDEAEKLDMNAWLYDEDRWPSGAGGGFVTKNPEYRIRCLVMTPPEKVPADSVFVAAFAVRMAGKRTMSTYRRLEHADEPVKRGEKKLVFSCVVSGTDSWYNGQTYLDTLNPEAEREFLRVTHEAYARETGGAFGKRIPGIFTDEPNFASIAGVKVVHIPWTKRLPGEFRSRFGYDLSEHLPELFLRSGDGDFSKVRLDYRNLLTDLFCECHGKLIGEWCEKHNLRYTGHLLCEDTLRSQTEYVGSAMRFYRHMQVPGIDLLTEHWNIFNTVKQCVSAARQAGRPVRLTETYGCTGWDFPFAGHKALGDWQAALGITLRCQHLAWYTMAAEAKRDYPASISRQSPWAEAFPAVEAYFAHLSAALSEGEEVRDLLVIHPVESVFGTLLPGDPGTPRMNAADRAFADLTNRLLERHLDFDFGEEALLAETGSVSGGILKAGKAEYTAVLIPELRTIRASTLKLLEKFAKNGGTVGFLGGVPSLVDGKPSARAAKTYAAFRGLKQTEIDAFFSPAVRHVSIREHGVEAGSVLYSIHRGSDFETLFVCNTGMKFSNRIMEAPLVRDRAIAHPETAIRWAVPKNYRIYELDLRTGKWFPAAASFRRGKQEFASPFAPLESHFYLASPAELPAEKRESSGFQTRAAGGGKSLAGKSFRITLDEPNVYLLDEPEWRVGDGSWNPAEPVLKIDDTLREMLGSPKRGGGMLQPWCVQKKQFSARTLPLTLRWTVNCGTVPPEGECRIALETPSVFTVSVNGIRASGKDLGFWCDPALRLLGVPSGSLRKGSNTVEFRCEYSADLPGLEAAFLLGPFGVRENRIEEPVTELPYGDWCEAGLPNYAGNVTCEIPLSGTGEVLEFPSWRGTALAVSTDGKHFEPIAWPPFAVSVKGLKKLYVRVYGSRRNAFGPFYLKEKWPAWTGPAQFKTYETKEHQLVPFGLLTPPEIR